MIENPRILDLLVIITQKCRENWALTGDCSIKKRVLKNALLEELAKEFELEIDLTWSNFQQKITSQRIKEEIQWVHDNFDDNIRILSKSRFIEFDEEILTTKIPFAELLDKVLSKDSTKIEETVTEISKFFAGSSDEMLEFLQRTGLVYIENQITKSNVVATKENVLDDVLTFIEESDALQIRYGIYDTIGTGKDLFSTMKFADDPFYLKLEYALRTLMREKFLLPLNIESNILKWEFRSRIAEIVRLLYKLRQRFYDHHSYRDSPRLTRSVKLKVVDRKFPIRRVHLSKCINEIQDQIESSSSWISLENSWKRIISVLIGSLEERGFGTISDFQHRCFKQVFNHLIDPESRSKGVVISAGTGMGKTLSYLGPLLLYILFEKSEKKNYGTKAICVYPRVKLAENQIEGFIKSIYTINQKLDVSGTKITIGIDYTGTPFERTDFQKDPKEGRLFAGINRLWKYDKNNDAYICPYAKCPQCNGDLYIKRKSNFFNKVPLECLNSDCGAIVDFVVYSKNDIAEEPPDIFITTTETLTTRLNTTRFQGLFGTEKFCTPKLIMFDEIHLHTSLKGSQIAFLIRRLRQRIRLAIQHSKKPSGEPLVLGLSATIGQAKEFFSELTGIPEYHIQVEGPKEDELVKSGVENFIFIKPEIGENIAILSNLLQTCMCILHNMPQPEEFPKRKRKSLGFVDSLDLVRRWQHDLQDAEKNKLYQLRDPEKIESEAWIRNYFGPLTTNCANCSTVVDKNCVHFQEGECWWFLRFGNSQSNPLEVKYKTASSGYVPTKYDLVVTTSAMEVGYDDPDIMCIVQYQSPMNIASFTQRKGRAGREIRNRPISVAVLSPYRTKDVYYYRNHHILIEPSFEKLPLNVENKAVKKIHGFYAILDFLSFEHREMNSDFPARVDENSIYELERILRRRKPCERYLKGVFDYKIDQKELKEIWSLIDELINRIRSTKLKFSISPSKLLSDHLPTNLFSSINLPTANIYEYNVYNNNEEWRKSWISGCGQRPNQPQNFLEILEEGYCPKLYSCAQKRKCKPKLLESDVDVNLALIQASIANVTFRWGQTAFWIPPYQIDEDQSIPLKQMDIRRNWLKHSQNQNSNEFLVKNKLVPKTLKQIVPRVNDGSQSNLPIIRPEIIRMTKFLIPGSEFSHWIYCFDHERIYAGTKRYSADHQGKNHHHDTITERTRSYPFAFYDIELSREILKENGRFKKTDMGSDFEIGRNFGTYGNLFSEIYFANKDTEEYLKVRKVIVGSTCNISTRNQRLQKVFGYIDGERDVGLGYSMDTDGIDLWIPKQIFKKVKIREEIPKVYNTLKRNLFKFEVLTATKKPGGRNSFSVSAFLDVYLAFATQNTSDKKELVKNHQTGILSNELKKRFRQTLESLFTLNSRTKREISKLLEDPEFLKIVIAAHMDILEEQNKVLISNYLEDTFYHSLKHALKSTFVVLGGFESERDIGGWTYLNFDYDSHAKQIYVFEHGMFGTGAFRNIYNKFRTDPQILWNLLDEYCLRCPSADEEYFLKEILRLEDTDLTELQKKVTKIDLSTSYVERKRRIHELVTTFRQKYLMNLKEEQVRSLRRLFAKPLELQKTTIKNWQLFKELNILLYEHLSNTFCRDLTVEEVQEACFGVLTDKLKEFELPTWKTFFALLKKMAKSEYSLILDKMRTNLERVKGLKKFLNTINSKQLEEMQHLSEEEQINQISKNLDCPKQQAKRIADILFQEIDDIPFFMYYYHLSESLPLPKALERKLRDSAGKRSLREEIEKRLLNTCIEACPSCLQTKCDIDFELRSKLLLSRRLVRHIVTKLKDKHTLSADSFSDWNNLKQKVGEKLLNNYQVIIEYSLNKSTDVARLVSELLGQGISKEGKHYRIFVNSSGYRNLSLKDRKVIYEMCLRCKESSL